jgi:myo-inositol-1(or 4)-monophosphatase
MTYRVELQFVQNLAKEAGSIMKKYFEAEEDLDHEWKDDHTPVTIADTKINRLVIDRVKAAYPKHGVLGEEESYKPERDLIWVVDPIDGTLPFSLGIPTSAFSIALVDRADGQPVVALTHDPFLDHTFYAVKGQGAYLNGKPIHTTDKYDLRHGYMCIGSKSGKGPGYEYSAGRVMEYFRDQGVKTLNYMSLVYGANRVATGQFYAAAGVGVYAWDMVACALLVQEAGGIVTDIKGDKRRFDETGDGFIMAANKQVHKLIVDKVKA